MKRFNRKKVATTKNGKRVSVLSLGSGFVIKRKVLFNKNDKA